MIFLQAGQNQVKFEDQTKELGVEWDNEPSVFIAKSPVMKKIHSKIKSLASLSSPVLILGASGTGRDRAAYEIFKEGKNSLKRFIKCVCYGLSPNMIEKQLFGDSEENGILNCGSFNTLFIDGLESCPPALQNKVLSYLLDHKSQTTAPRLICSASDNFPEKVKERSFSRALFEALSQNLLILPSLSERAEDVPFFISLFNKKNDFKGCISPPALEALKRRSWAGNITELKNVCLQMAIMLSDKSIIDESDLALIIKKEPLAKRELKYDPQLSLEDLINCYIQMSLRHFRSKKKSAEALGISVKTIYNKIKTGQVAYSD